MSDILPQISENPLEFQLRRLKIQQHGLTKALPKIIFRFLRYLAKGIICFAILLPASLSGPRARRQTVTDCLIEFASAAGMLLGLTPIRVQRYRQLHGK